MLPLCGYEIPASIVLDEPATKCAHLARYRVHGNGETCDACSEHAEEIAELLGASRVVLEAIA